MKKQVKSVKMVDRVKGLLGLTQDKGTNLMERIARESELKEQIKEIQTKLGSLSQHSPLGENPAELKTRIDSLINRYGGGNEASITDGRAKAELRDLKAQHEAKVAKSRHDSAQKMQLQDELTALREELQSFNYTAEVEEVMEHLTKIGKAAQVVASLKSTVSEQEAIVAANTGLTVGSLYQTREDLLAESVLGKEVAIEIEELEAEIALKEAALAEGEKVKGNAERAIVGLKRKLVDEELVLKRLQDDKKVVLCHFLINRAEQVGSEYLEAAAELQEAYGRLMGLDELIQSLGRGAPSLLLSAHQINIPSFKLKVFGEPGEVFSGRGYDTGAARLDVVAELGEIGITM